jgi:LysR family hydrogen peroxide-inducible transcriptional activator
VKEFAFYWQTSFTQGTVDTNQLRYFVAVVDHGSFSKAAARCNISQSNLSEQIQKLEGRVGKSLLNRNHRRIVPTEAGDILLRRATRILAHIEKAKHEIRCCDEIRAGKVSFGVSPTIAPCFLAHVLESFVERYPKIQLFVHENIAEQSLQMIEAGKLDLGLVSLPVREHGFETEILFSEEMLLALHPSHPLARKRTIFKEDLLSEKFILSQEDHCLGGCVIGLCRKSNFNPNIVFRCGQFATIQSLVAAGKGISLIPQMAIAEASASITYRQLEAPRPKRDIAIVTRNKRPLKLAAQEFLKHLRLAGKDFAASRLKK